MAHSIVCEKTSVYTEAAYRKHSGASLAKPPAAPANPLYALDPLVYGSTLRPYVPLDPLVDPLVRGAYR